MTIDYIEKNDHFLEQKFWGSVFKSWYMYIINSVIMISVKGMSLCTCFMR